jgi:signal transduction histidine kinase
MFKLPVALKFRTRFRFICLMAVAMSLCAIAGFFFVRYLVKPFTGLVITFPEVRIDNGKVIYSPRVSDSPALRAGLIPEKDQILALNGRGIHSVRELVTWEAGLYSFEPVSVTVANELHTVRQVVIQPQMSVAQSGWFSVLFFIVILGAISIYILMHYQNEITHTLFALFALLYMVYTSVQPFYYESPLTMFFVNPGEQTVWSVLIFLAFFQKDIISKRVRNVLVAVFCAVILFFTVDRFLQYTRWLVLGLDSIYQDLQFVRQLQNICDVPGYVLFIVFLLFIYLRTRHRDIKIHIEWITAGALLALPSHFFFDQLPQILHNIQSNPYYMGNPSNFFLAFIPLSYIIGLVRSRGLQLKVLRSRSIMYITSAFGMLAFFAALFQPVQRLFTDIFKLNADISGFIVALSLLIAALYLQLVLFLIIDRRLLRGKQRDPSAADAVEDASPQTRRTQESHRETDLLLTGLIERFDVFLDQTRSHCMEIQKISPGPAEKTRLTGKTEPGDDPSSRPAERLFNSMRKHIVAFEQFRKRFEVILKRQASIRISLALDALLDSVITQSRRQWNGIVIQYQRRPGLKVFCSPEEIALCLLYGIENAYEALIRKTDGIIVTARNETGGLIIEIVDPGSGVLLKNIAQAGQPFFTTKRDHDGLGLYFMGMLLERNNATWSIEPGIETGTRLILRLPPAKVTSPRAPETTPPAAQENRA